MAPDIDRLTAPDDPKLAISHHNLTLLQTVLNRIKIFVIQCNDNSDIRNDKSPWTDEMTITFDK